MVSRNVAGSFITQMVSSSGQQNHSKWAAESFKVCSEVPEMFAGHHD
jgi:hypothetical protein